MQRALKQTYIQTGVSLLLIILFCVTVTLFWYQVRIATETIVAEDVTILSGIFKRINDCCGITDFRYQQQNYIDFLNVISFEGYELSTMILNHPDKWQGPYLTENPTVQGKYYQIVKTNKGYFIAPGNGVKLKNGKVIGKDIVLDKNADIAKMMTDPDLLQFKDKSLAASIEVSQEKPLHPLEKFID
jgi:hypothetical protein